MSAGSSVIGSGLIGSASTSVVVTKSSVVLVVGGSVVVVASRAVVGGMVAVGRGSGNGRLEVGKIVVKIVVT
jgi:hypothetical protein